MMWWIGHILGLDDVSGPWYAWWSGVGANVGLLGGAFVVVRKHQCHVKRCWRIGRHPAGDFHVCRKHHPGIAAPTAQEVREHWLSGP